MRTNGRIYTQRGGGWMSVAGGGEEEGEGEWQMTLKNDRRKTGRHLFGQEGRGVADN